jgi:cysteine desulfurase/selenocysteine lyase
VIDAQLDFAQNNYASAGRGVCERADNADKMVARARSAAAGFIGAEPRQIVFTGGATDGLNRIPRILEKSSALSAHARVLVSNLDHHSARMPWEELRREGKCAIEVCPLDKEHSLAPELVGKKCDVFVLTSMSNVLGSRQDIKKIIAAARRGNPDIKIIADASQSVVHEIADVRKWDVDFMVFSAHKIGADTGLGVMYMKEPEKWLPDKFGGGMVSRASGGPTENESRWTLMPPPHNFEAGTLPLTQLAGLPEAIRSHESEAGDNIRNMTDYLRCELSKIPRIKFVSPKDAALLTFIADGMHALDFGAMMGARGVCLRVGNMCASWLHRHLGLEGTIRISAGPWNTMEDMEETAKIIKKITK